MTKEVNTQAKEKMHKVVESLTHELSTIRTGRATISLLDGIRVNYYGSNIPLNQVANLAVQEPRLLIIQPWEKNMLPVIEKTILASDLGLTPSNDGTVIRLPIPQLTEERRRGLVKLVRKLAEEGRVTVRNIRREANEIIKTKEKKGEISEDDSRETQKEIQEITDNFIKQIDEVLEKKEEEIIQV